MNVDDLTTATTQYFTHRDENRTLAQIGVWQESGQTLVDRGEPERLRSLLVSHGLLQALGVQPKSGGGGVCDTYNCVQLPLTG